MPYFCVDRMMIGVRYAMISTMYCAICVQVTARMPPSMAHSRMPTRPTNTAISNVMPRKRDAIRPVPKISRCHIGERAAHQHDHGEEACDVAAVTERHEVRDRIGAELAQVRADQDRHQHEAAGPAEHPGEAVIAEQEQRAGHADERGRRHPVGAGRHAVVDHAERAGPRRNIRTCAVRVMTPMTA